jgi:mono/diheme cytochrome c family protein
VTLRHQVLIAVLIAACVAGVLARAGSKDAGGPDLWTRQIAAEPAHPVSSGAVQTRAILDKYCISCHNQQRKTANLALDEMDVARVSGDAEGWEKVVAKLRAGEMPPRGAPQPDLGTRYALITSLESSIDRAAEANPNPGRVSAHRLNRTEYTNAIRDLLALNIDGRALLAPDDVDRQGFDNIAGVLSVSPVHMERYMAAARTISRLAVGDPTFVPVFDTYQLVRAWDQDQRMSDDLPFGTRGGLAVRHTFPLNGEYIVKVRLQRQLYDYLIGMGFPHDLEVRVSGKRVGLLTVGGAAKGQPAPATFNGNIISDTEWEAYMHDADAKLEVRFTAEAGTHVVGVSFLDGHLEPEGIVLPLQADYDAMLNEHYDGNPRIESVAIGGPYKPDGPGETESRRRIFVCYPSRAAEEPACARRILSMLARRAYRRPVNDADIQTLVDFYESGRRQGGFESGIQHALQRLLADPDFIFRLERDPSTKQTVYRLTDLELASRVSFFLWSSIPDAELLDVAEQGRLKNPVVLEQQVRRMLKDRRSKALIENFASQWLRLRELSGVTPDPHLYPEFNENLREAFRKETELFVESQFSEDRSVLDLLTANYSFLNEQLAAHYGVRNVYGSHFRRVPLSNSDRGGLLSHGSLLTVTSYPNRTSPVLRGKWLLDNILGSPPPPPPPDVPDLQESGKNGRRLSMREQMEVHRKNPVCASCHVRMDQLGFALERFDPIGRVRAGEDGMPIDVSAVLPDGTRFDGLPGLRKLLVDHHEEFVATVTEKMLTYAVGRQVEYFDMPAVRKIQREAAAGKYRWSALILGIVKSAPFQMRRTES